MTQTCNLATGWRAARDKEVYMKVKASEEVKDIILTYCEYDLILKIESNSLEDLDHFIFNKLRAIDGITTTTTLLEAQPKSFTKDG